MREMWEGATSPQRVQPSHQIMNHSALVQLLSKKPSVHQLCYGIYLQAPLRLQENLIAVPLTALGFGSQAQFMAKYAREVAGALVDESATDALTQQGAQAFPTIAIVYFHAEDGEPIELEKLSAEVFVQTRRILGWVAGDAVEPFAMLTCTESHSAFRLIMPNSRRRLRLGFGNTEAEFQTQLEKISERARCDPHFEYALSFLHDALRESNALFKIARLYNCLECLAANLKAKHSGKSRKAVKDLLGLEGGAIEKLHMVGVSYEYDVIEIAGRIRDKLFHGAAFREDALNAASKPVFALLETNPEHVISSLLAFCEVEISRWANGVSRGNSTAKS